MLAAFEAIDWAIVAFYLACMLGVGFYVRPFISNVGDYIVAGRAVGFGLAISTMIGTELGLVTLAYMGQLGFTGGLAGFHVALVHMSMGLVVGFTGFIIYRLRKAGVMTIPEYYRKRYGPRTHLLGGIILVLAGVLNMGMFLKAGAIVIGGLTGLTKDVEINLIMTALLGIVLAYTVMGGMVSVVVTDFLQFIVVGVSMLIVTLFCFHGVDWDFSKAVRLLTEYRTRQGDQMARAEMIAAAAELEQTDTKVKNAPAAARRAEQAIQRLRAQAAELKPQEDEALAAFAAAAAALQKAEQALEKAIARSGQTSPEAAKAEAEVQAAQQRLEPPSARLRRVAAASKALEAKLLEARKELSSARADAEGAREALPESRRRFGQAREAYAAGDAGQKSAEAAFNPFHGKGFGSLYVLWMGLVALTGYALWQPATMRALMARSPSVAKRAYVGASLGFLVRFMIPMFWGICAFIFIMEHADLKEMFFPAVGAGEDTLKATAMFLARILPVGITGFVMAGLLASFMSTHDSYLMAWSSSIVQDVIAPIAGEKRLSSRARVLLTRLFVLLIALFLLLWGLWFPMRGRLWGYLAITGTIYFAGAVAVVGGGLYWRRASSTGAVIALCAGLLAILGILPWQDWGKQWNVDLAFMSNQNIAIVAFGLAIAGMIVGSLLFPDRKRKEVQP